MSERYACVRQLAGRKGEVWGAESGADKLFVLKRQSRGTRCEMYSARIEDQLLTAPAWDGRDATLTDATAKVAGEKISASSPEMTILRHASRGRVLLTTRRQPAFNREWRLHREVMVAV